MRSNTSEYDKAYYQANGSKLTASRRESVDKRRRENYSWISKLKESSPCVDCGKFYPACVMDFDHLGDKKFGISHSLTRSREVIEREIAKCELVCSNCHRIRTHNRRGAVAESGLMHLS